MGLTQFPSGGGSATPGGSSGQAQYNNAGAFDGFSGLTITAGVLQTGVLAGNGAASTPPLLLSGTWFSGGSGTTTKPQLLIEPSGTTSTAWNTSGTAFGVNAANGFAGMLLDLKINNASKLTYNNDGNGYLTCGAGTFILANGSGQQFKLYSSSLLQTTGTSFRFDGGSGDVSTFSGSLTVSPSGSAAITVANATATGIKFNGYGAGAITSDASGNLTAVSDERLKTSIKPFTRGLADVVALAKLGGSILYKWAEGSGMETEHEYAGFSAQKVMQALPEAVSVNGEGMLSLNDRGILAALVNAVNELSERL